MNPAPPLNAEQAAQICKWLTNGLPHSRVRELALAEFGSEPDAATLAQLWDEHCVPQLVQQRQRAAQTAETIAADCARHPARFDAATIDLLKQKAFEVLLNPQVETRTIKSLVSLALKLRDQEFEDRRLRLQERRLEQAQAAEDTLQNQTLSTEQKQLRLREIFGIPTHS